MPERRYRNNATWGVWRAAYYPFDAPALLRRTLSRRRQLHHCPVAFLELLAAATRAGVVAPHTGVGIGRKGRLSRPTTLDGAWARGGLAARNQPVGRGFRSHHGRLTSSRARQATGRSRHTPAGRALHARRGGGPH